MIESIPIQPVVADAVDEVLMIVTLVALIAGDT